MKELVIWFVVMLPRPACIEKDKKDNFIKYVDPATNMAAEARIRGEAPVERSLIKFAETQPDIKSDECYDVYVASSKPKWALIPPAPAPAEKKSEPQKTEKAHETTKKQP